VQKSHSDAEGDAVDGRRPHRPPASRWLASIHVGIGSDFDGIDVTPVGLEDVSTYPN
jgi:hypothetical protein